MKSIKPFLTLIGAVALVATACGKKDNAAMSDTTAMRMDSAHVDSSAIKRDSAVADSIRKADSAKRDTIKH